MKRTLPLFALLIALQPMPTQAASPEKVDFQLQIRPILTEYCLNCHGPNEKKRKGKLRLDTADGPEGAFTKRKDDPAVIIPGNPDDSEFYYRITVDDPDELMPPPEKSKKMLTKEQIELLRRWIEQGAAFEKHWAFMTPKQPALPKVSKADWPRNEIDRFILARLDKEGLTPSPEADRRTLIRRVTLDLTGLPPTPEQVDAFVNDKSANAYEKLVDRLLNSSRYGEHMGRYWLDVARYADTHGLHLDNYREIWPYRDWVIKAFNANLPFDRFVTDQMAGDLLPKPTLDQLVATGFNRSHITTNEGGSIAEEVRVRNVVDRVNTTGTVFLALTFECSRCHDHKYDPISQKEFYQLFAFFNSLDGNAMDGNRKDPAPVASVASPEQKKQLADIEQQLAGVRKKISADLAKVSYTDPGPDAKPAREPVETVWINDAVPQGAREEGTWQWVGGPDNPVFAGMLAAKRTAKGMSQHVFTGAAPALTVEGNDTLFAHVYLDPKNPPKQIMLQWNDGTWEHRAYWGGNHINWGKNGTPSRRHMGKLPETGKWVRLEVPASQVGLSKKKPINGWAFTQFDGTVYWDKAGTVGKPEIRFRSLLAWTNYLSRKGNQKAAPPNVVKAAKLRPTKRNAAQKKLLREHFLQHIHADTSPRFKPLQDQVAKLEDQAKKTRSGFVTTLIWKELAKPRPAYFLKRGQYDLPDKEAGPLTRDVLQALPAFPKDSPRNRLGLAQWLLDPDHPLTSRVTVNRFWQQVFGMGIVKTTENFGGQGELPSHPGLMDWLAVQFIDDGWDVKKLVKRLVTSATYRQSSRITPALFERDPENRLFARGPRFRLDAEVLRDQALAVSGLLVEKIGGPGVKPPQPDGLWFAVGYSGSNTVRFKQDTGPDKVYRRSLYTFWKRTSPPPQMNTFDAPSREECSVRRERTNTPLQALLLMNDPQYVEAARHLAQLAMTKASRSPESRAAYIFERAAARAPDKDDLANLLSAYRVQLASYKAAPEDAEKLIAVGESKPNPALDATELAAWTMVANLVLNLDEVITRK